MPAVLFLLLFNTCAIVHPFFISMTDINYNNKSRSVEVSVRIFTDDLEKTLKKNCNCKVDLTNPADKKAMDNVLSSYISNHLSVKINGTAQSLSFSGFQKEEESTWAYFEIKNISSFKNLELHNSLLHDYKNEQINMVHVKANGKEQTDKLDFPETVFSASF